MKTNGLLDFYVLGFENKLSVENLPNDNMLLMAYKLGEKHASEGNDKKTIEFLNDELVAFLIEKEMVV